MLDWHRSDLYVRWKYGLPPKGNANFAWVQHFIHYMSPKGFAGFVLANGSTSSYHSGEGEIRKTIIDTDLVDCMIFTLRPDKVRINLLNSIIFATIDYHMRFTKRI